MSKRVRFFIGHLSISFVFILLLALLIFLVWFIPPLGKATGILPIFAMLIVIDLFIGPLLGFLVYKEGKKTLKFDLSIVILLQIGLFLYGSYIIAQSRPAWIIYNSGSFDLVRSFEVETKNINQVKSEFQKKPLLFPKFAAVRSLPNSQRFIELQSGVSVVQNPERYVNLHDEYQKSGIKTQSLGLLKQYNSPEKVQKVLKSYPQANSFIPLKVENTRLVVLFNNRSGEVVKIVDLHSSR